MAVARIPRLRHDGRVCIYYCVVVLGYEDIVWWVDRRDIVRGIFCVDWVLGLHFDR